MNDKKITLIEKIPQGALLLIVVFLLLLLTALLAYALWDNRTIELWPPKILARQDIPLAANKMKDEAIIDGFIEGFDVPVLVYRNQERGIIIISANQAAADFYTVTREQLLGKSPADLHIWIKSWVSNFNDWSAEQMLRIAQTSGPLKKPIGKTSVPMSLLPTHPSYKGNWYITSNVIKINDKPLIVTRFSRNPDSP